MENAKKSSDVIDYESIFDPDLTIEEYNQKLDELLRQYGKTLIERRTIIRQKSQEFREKIRTRDSRKR